MSDVKITIGQTGAEQAAAGVEKLAQSTRNAEQASRLHGGSMVETLHNAHRLEGGLNQVERALGGATEGSHAFGGALRVMAQGFRALMMDGPQLIITGALIALGMAINKVVEYFSALKKAHEDAAKAAEAQIEQLKKFDGIRLSAIKKQYDDLEKSITASADAADRVYAAQLKLMGAKERLAVSRIEAKSKSDIAGLDTSSPDYASNKAAIEAGAAEAISGVQTSFEEEKAHVELYEALNRQDEMKQKYSAQQTKIEKTGADYLRLEKEKKKLGFFEDEQTNPNSQHWGESKEDFELRQANHIRILEGLGNAQAAFETGKSTGDELANKLQASDMGVSAAQAGVSAAGFEGVGKSLGFVAHNREVYQSDAPVIAALDQANAANAALTAAFLKFAQSTVANHQAAANKLADLSRNSNMGSN